MNRSILVLAAGAAIGTYLYTTRDAKASDKPTDDPTTGLPELPTPEQVPGADLDSNWGSTPEELRPLFIAMERISGIDGAARIFSVISFREAIRWKIKAHNTEPVEVDASRRSIENNRGRNPKLKYEEEAAAFGSGGLFGALAPYFLWTGVPEIGKRAPLLDAPPEIMFTPRFAAFGAMVYLKRLVKNHKLVDHLDIKVGWANPSILRKGAGEKYDKIRTRFGQDAAKVGINLNDTSTIPAVLNADAWPGILPVYRQITGDNNYEFARAV